MSRVASRMGRRRMLVGALLVLALVILVSRLHVGGGVSGPGLVTWRSGVFAGYGPAADERFAVWRGAALRSATDFLGSGTWSELEDPSYAISQWSADPAAHPDFSVAMWPASGGDLATAASGAYDVHFAALARNLVAAGLGRAGIRLAWEFNGTWYRWSVRTVAEAAEFAAAWRHVVSAMRSVPGAGFSFDWAPTLQSGGINPALAYPGDVYVTVVGLDVYDWSQGPRPFTPLRRWHQLVGAVYGLAWQARFAAAHGKPIAFPEWGLVSYAPNPTLAGGDDPTFVREMFDWFRRHHVAFENYFDSDVPAIGTYYGLTTRSARFPAATRLYRRLYAQRGHDGAP